MGLFENPFAPTGQPTKVYSAAHLAAARDAAIKSAVLLKNNNQLLPLDAGKKIAVIGPMADAPHDQMGTWVFDGQKEHTVTPLKALQTEYKNINYVYEPALAFSRDKNKGNFDKAIAAAKQADVVVVFLGEEAILSGEAHSLSNINLIGVQSDLLAALKAANKPVVLVIMAGRPLTIERDLPYADAVLYNFHPGTMGGPAILDLLYGKATPGGKLPVTFVREVGQIPMYYNHNNTGRPGPKNPMKLDDIPLEAKQSSLGNSSFYLDSGRDPLFPFGYGLSYTSFEYNDLKLSAAKIAPREKLKLSVTLKNTGKYEGTEVVQLYVQDVAGSIARPVKELKGYQKISLKPGESKLVTFELSSADLAFYGLDLVKKYESGMFNIWVGGNSDSGLKSSFSLTE
ncbi:glycoside hydrolase family 3 C-terminal domain-containing protein [Niabella hibiscisoli]|nr:glycoside hydrolase family 3 C-terminal domain-containing protein [Niabella hibiscisoli]